MFPQTELDNYKLQVELLQEKLQKSEISRQQLEHQLDKILLKREEQEKTARIKSKEKYHLFLKEQQRRNERNKQLVQMLEHIEQQTLAINARSERLKMMKLQYEMYFAKLVHSQTRRCIQSSVAGTVPIVATSSLPRSVGHTMMMPTTLMEGFNYTNVYGEPPQVGNVYQSFPDTRIERDHFTQLREPTIIETPLSDFTLSTERSDYLEMRKPDPYLVRQQGYDENVTKTNLDERKHEINDSMPITREQVIYKNYQENKGIPLSPTSTSFERNNDTLHLDMPTTVSSSSTAHTFRRTPNDFQASNTSSNSIASFDNGNTFGQPNNRKLEIESQPLQQNIKNIPEYKPDLVSLDSKFPQNIKIDDENSNDDVVQRNGIKLIPQMQKLSTQDVNLSPPSNYATLSEKKPVESNQLKGGNMMVNRKQPASRENAAPASITSPVSLENIENAIYGELVNPLEETKQTQEKPLVVPELLDSLVTQAPRVIETTAITPEPTNQPTEQYPTEANATINKNETPLEDSQLPIEAQPAYEQSYSYSTSNTNSTTDDGQNNTNVDYTDYDVTKTLDGDNQQQQEYDYTNYDPSEYSYPGYIYDETTGEYKPDPNASAEQYATDQQYAQGYDQQYQQEGYEYNQAYEQETPHTSEADPAAYANYDTTQQLEQPTTSAETDSTIAGQALTRHPNPQESVAKPTELESTALGDSAEQPIQNTKPNSILSTTEKNDQKKKKRVNFVDSSETDSSSVDKVATQGAVKQPSAVNESDFDFSSGSEVGAKPS